jgi:hypothetical protein
VIACDDPPVIAAAEPPVIACDDPPVIALTPLSLVPATAVTGSVVAISDAPRMARILAPLAVRIFHLPTKRFTPTLPFAFFEWPPSVFDQRFSFNFPKVLSSYFSNLR